jgi:electron transport complex protein RnfD
MTTLPDVREQDMAPGKLVTCADMNLATLLTSRNHVLTTPQIMLLVLLAALPGITVMTLHFGPGVLINIVWVGLCALLLEALMLKLRQRPIKAGLSDNSALVTALLLALSLPPATPWWAGLIGAIFAIVVAKHLYGGLGYNPFNPAMVGYAVLLIAFPVTMTQWLLPASAAGGTPTLAASLAAFAGMPAPALDAFVGATALDQFKLERGGQTAAEFMTGNPLYGRLSGAGWQWVNMAFLAGGLYLLYRRLISWHIPVTLLGVMVIMALLLYDGGSSGGHGSPLLHLFGGATMFGAFFIATDPVTGPATTTAKLWYAALIGMLIMAIRVWGSYPDGVAFAVLLANFAAPAMDRFVQLSGSGDSADAG